MSRPSMTLKAIEDYLYLTFPLRRILLLGVVALSIVPGAFVTLLPVDIRLVYAYVLTTIAALTFFCMYGSFKGVILQAFGAMVYGRKFKPSEYITPEIKQLAKKMGIKEDVQVYITTNPWIRGPYTNGFNGKVYIPQSWMNKFADEIMWAIAHEFVHVRTRKRFTLEVMAALGAVMTFSFVFALFTIPIIVQIAQYALAFLVISRISWMNERRADFEAAKALGPEGLISIFEQLKSESKRDEGSESHPPLHDRINRLSALLDK